MFNLMKPYWLFPVRSPHIRWLVTEVYSATLCSYLDYMKSGNRNSTETFRDWRIIAADRHTPSITRARHSHSRKKYSKVAVAFHVSTVLEPTCWWQTTVSVDMIAPYSFSPWDAGVTERDKWAEYTIWSCGVGPRYTDTRICSPIYISQAFIRTCAFCFEPFINLYLHSYHLVSPVPKVKIQQIFDLECE